MHDIQEKRYPEFFSKSQKIYRNLNVRNTLKLASHIQVSSHFVKKEIQKYYPEESIKTTFVVIPEGVNLLPSRAQGERLMAKRQNSVILPASFHPHKNQVILLDVFNHLKSKIKICVTGDVGIHEKREQFQILTRKHDFHLLGFVSEEELGAIYRKSSIVLSTSLYESSSLPLLEGISNGCIPVASDIPAHREMALNLTIFLFNPNDPAELAATLDMIASLSDEKLREIHQWNSEALKEYSWQSIANKYVEVLSRI
jgi:glycosyltransferase involved in cell wall biosynthesis